MTATAASSMAIYLPAVIVVAGINRTSAHLICVWVDFAAVVAAAR